MSSLLPGTILPVPQGGFHFAGEEIDVVWFIQVGTHWLVPVGKSYHQGYFLKFQQIVELWAVFSTFG
jgi:hypothetical protein